MLNIETLDDLKRSNVTIYGNCTGRDCGHGQALDLDALIERYGPDYVVINETRIGPALRCRRCGHRGGVLTLSPPSSHCA